MLLSVLIKGVNKCNWHLILEHLDPGLNLPVKLRPSRPDQKSTVTDGLRGKEVMSSIKSLRPLAYSSSSFRLTLTLETEVNRGSTSFMNDLNQGVSIIPIGSPPLPHKFLAYDSTMASWFLNSICFLTIDPLVANVV